MSNIVRGKIALAYNAKSEEWNADGASFQSDEESKRNAMQWLANQGHATDVIRYVEFSFPKPQIEAQTIVGDVTDE